MELDPKKGEEEESSQNASQEEKEKKMEGKSQKSPTQDDEWTETKEILLTTLKKQGREKEMEQEWDKLQELFASIFPQMAEEPMKGKGQGEGNVAEEPPKVQAQTNSPIHEKMEDTENKGYDELESSSVETTDVPESSDVLQTPLTMPLSTEPTTTATTTPSSLVQTLKEKKNSISIRKKENKKKNRAKESGVHCSYCNIMVANSIQMQIHTSSDLHQQNIMSDQGRVWKHREPPRGIGPEEYKMCLQIQTEGGVCRFGDQCVEAHSIEELLEWNQRFEFRQKKSKKAVKMFGKSFVDTIMEKLSAAKQPSAILKTSIEGVDVKCASELNTKVSSKNEKKSWIFELKSQHLTLVNVGMLNEADKAQFSLEFIKHLGELKDSQNSDSFVKTYFVNSDTTSTSQEWTHPGPNNDNTISNSYQVKITFKTEVFGIFRQVVAFNFGSDVLRQDLCIGVQPQVEEADEEARSFLETIVQQPEKWDSTNREIKDFIPPLIQPSVEDFPLLKSYPSPRPQTFKLSPNVLSPNLTRLNYVSRMHELLWIEEMAQFGHLAQFNVITKLHLIKTYLLTPTSTSSSTAKYARPGELFGKMTLGTTLSEDTPAGRLVLTNCSMVFLSQPLSSKSMNRIAYVAGIEDEGKNTLYLRLSPDMVNNFSLVSGEELEVEVQFQLNRVPLCEMHYAIDRLSDLNMVYPDVQSKLQIPWTPGKQWAEDMDANLNAKQKEAILAITTQINLPLPPILIIGPYGTGKTFTLAQGIMLLLKQQSQKRRILVCTHSNSAADLYIKDYLDPFLEKNKQIRLLRVYYKNRWVQTVNDIVLKYCLVDRSETSRSFRNPTLEEVKGCDVVVTTLATSRFLSTIGLEKGYFTHILIDEAAQALECETVMPLALASSTTRVVLAGDHMQLSPEVFSQFAMEKNFNKSLLERLYDLYPPGFPCKILLCENYRSHEAIVKYTSELFYEQKLISSGKQLQHDFWFPLTVFTARGEDVQDANSTSFYNNAEVYEIVDRVSELQRNWPVSWGKRDETSIGIVAHYYDQVQRIRSELRKRKLYGVSVERVLNVQGKQFRAIFLSTVRTRKTCLPMQKTDKNCDFGFLSNAKLLNTAITRAQSLVAVVGDPVSLCSIGKCRKLWEKFCAISNQNGCLFGLTMKGLMAMLSQVEFKKTFILNPYAPEFVPRSRQYHETLMWQSKALANAASQSPISQPPTNFQQPQHHQSPQQHRNSQQHLVRNNRPPPPIPSLPAVPLSAPPIMHPYLGPPSHFPFPLPPPPSSLATSHTQQIPPSLLTQPGLFNTPPMINPYSTIPPYPGPWMKFFPGAMNPPPGSSKALLGMIPPKPMQPASSVWPQQVASRHQTSMLPPAVASLNSRTLRHANSSPSLGLHSQPPHNIQQHLPQTQPHNPSSPVSTSLLRQANPHFANSRYQRSSNVESQERGPPPDFVLRREGIHLPQEKVIGNTAAVARSREQEVTSGRMPTLPAAKTSESLISTLELLPQDLDISVLLRSPSMQLAWYNLVLLNHGKEKADDVRELFSTLIQCPEMIPFVENRSKGRDSKSFNTSVRKTAILAQDLEALMLQESKKVEQVDQSAMVDSFFAASSSPINAAASASYSKKNVPSKEEGQSYLNEILKNDPVFSDIIGLEDDRTFDLLLEVPNASDGVEDDVNQLPLYKRHLRSQSPPPPPPSTTPRSQLPELPQYDSQSPSYSSFQARSNFFNSPTPAYNSSRDDDTPTYANVLRTNQLQRLAQTMSDGEDNSSNLDPLTRIRNLGNRGNQENGSRLEFNLLNFGRP